MAKLIEWLKGKKTMLGGTLILLAALAGIFFAQISIVDGSTIAGFGIAIIGYGDKANRHQAQILEALKDVAAAGEAYRNGNLRGAMNEIARTASRDGLQAFIEQDYAGPATGPAGTTGTAGPAGPSR